LGSGGHPITVGSNGVRFNFAEEPPLDPRMEKHMLGSAK
jgi:hypothetical protein